MGGKSARVRPAPPPPPLLRLRVVDVHRLAVAVALPAAVDRQEDAQHPREEAEGPDLFINNDTPPGTAATARHRWRGRGRGWGRTTSVLRNSHVLWFVAWTALVGLSQVFGRVCTLLEQWTQHTLLVGNTNRHLRIHETTQDGICWGDDLCAPLPPPRLPIEVPTW